MMRDKQIEEMANIIFESSPIPSVWRSDAVRFAEVLYNAGYRKASDVAREIFEEIEKILDLDKITDGLHFDAYWGADVAFGRVENKIAELKKKYESEGEG